MARQDLALEVFLVAIPEEGRFAVERGCAGVKKGRLVSTRKFVLRDNSSTLADSLVRLAQQALDAQEHALGVQGGAPCTLLALPAGLQDVEADAAAHVDVGVVDGRLEKDFWRGVRVVCREGEGQLEGERVVWGVGGAEQGCVPVGEVGCREGGDAGCGRGHEGHEFGLQAVERDAVRDLLGGMVV